MGLEEGSGSPRLADTTSSTDQLEHFIHVELINEVVSQDDVGNGEVGTITERLISDDESKEVRRGKLFYLIQIFGT